MNSNIKDEAQMLLLMKKVSTLPSSMKVTDDLFAIMGLEETNHGQCGK